MLGSIGMPELIIIFVIALIIFGPRKLPELGRSLGKSLAEFKRASNELRSTLEEEIRIEDQKATAAPKAAEPPGAPIETHPDEPVCVRKEGRQERIVGPRSFPGPQAGACARPRSDDDESPGGQMRFSGASRRAPEAHRQRPHRRRRVRGSGFS